VYASRAVPMAARNAVVGLIEVADGRSRSALFSGLNRRLERVKAARLARIGKVSSVGSLCTLLALNSPGVGVGLCAGDGKWGWGRWTRVRRVSEKSSEFRRENVWLEHALG